MCRSINCRHHPHRYTASWWRWLRWLNNTGFACYLSRSVSRERNEQHGVGGLLCRCVYGLSPLRHWCWN